MKEYLLYILVFGFTINVNAQEFKGLDASPMDAASFPSSYKESDKLVKITYKVALSNFNKVSSSAFLIECDYNMTKVNNLPYLIPKLVESPSMVRNIRIAPLKIDFIINK